ncbi:IS4 family transposase [Bradyrhizobium sp.]|uniref:IS4 family transposase n=1 Tax=Bradyrhizobium sp. TaxID=376 RepID=UPI003C575F41
MDARQPLQDKDIQCLGHLRKVYDLLDALDRVGCRRDRAGNRRLHFGVYCKLMLLYIWNPLIDSLRVLQQAAELKTVGRALGMGRFSLGSFSESARVFEPEQLEPIIAELAGQVRASAQDARLGAVEHVITLVDGTVMRGLTRMVRSACGPEGRYNTSRDGLPVYGWKLHTQLDLETLTPHRIDRTGARNAGEHRENNVLRRNLEKDRCYVADGGYSDQTLFDDITDAASSFVIRMREDSVFENVLEERELSQEALDAGVVRDAIVQLPGARYPIRIVLVKVQPHPRRVRGGVKPSEHVLLATNLLDLATELVTLVYLKRYTVELFFRTLKSLLGMRHLLSQREQGIDIQVHCTVIVCLLICLITGKQPNKYNRNMIGWYLSGLASQEELLDHLNRPDNRGAKKRAKDELWKKLGV